MSTGPAFPRRTWLLAALGLLLLLAAAFPGAAGGRTVLDGTGHLHRSDALHAPPPGPDVQLPGGMYDNSSELAHLPWDVRAYRLVRGGEPPFWQPDNGFGSPLLGNAQSAVLSPVKWLMLPASAGYWSTGFLLGRLYLAGLGTLALGAALGLSPAAGFLAGAGFMLAGMNVHHVHMPDTHVVVFLPWLLLAALALARRPDARRTGILGLAIGVTGLLGHPEPAIVGGLAAVAVAAAEGRARRTPMRALGAALAGAIALGAGLAAVVVLPFLEWASLSRSYLFDQRQLFPWLDLPHVAFYALTHLLTPLGTNVHFNAFVGAVAALLAPLGLLAPRVRPAALALAAVTLGCYLLCPPAGLLTFVHVLPNTFYAPPALALAIALLGGAGLDRLDAPGARHVAAAGALAGLALVAYAWLPVPRALGDMGAAGPVLLAAAALLLARPRAVATAGLLAIACADLARGAWALAPGLPPHGYPAGPVVRHMQAGPPLARAAGLGEAFLPDSNLMYGVASIEAFDAFHLRRYSAYMAALNRTPAQAILNFRLLDPGFDPGLADLAGLRWLVLGPGPRGQALRARLPAAPVATQPGVTLHERPTALPRARVVHEAAFVAAPAAEGRLGAGAAGWRTRALIETPDGRAPAGWHDAPGPATEATIVAYGAHRVEVATAPAGPGWLVLADAYYPGWTAEIDGEPAPILPAYVAFRAVQVPAGAHRVVFTYAPASVRAGGTIALASLLLALLLMLRGLNLSGKQRPGTV